MSHLRIIAALVAFALPLSAQALQTGGALKATPLLKTTTTWDGAPITYPEGPAEITAVRIELAVGGQTGWHRHPVGSYAYVLQGELEISLGDGRSQRVSAGDVLAEVIGTPHNGRNVGEVPVQLIVFYTGAVGDTLTSFVKR